MVTVSITAILLTSFSQFPISASVSNEVWTTRTSASDNDWRSVTYGNGLYVAVASSGTGNRVMTSPDGINWTSRNSAADLFWLSVTYGNGLFVAVARTISATGTNNRVMTSSDGINWTTRTSAADNDWVSVTYGNGLFVAVAANGGDSDATKATKRVMTSPDAITWTLQTPANTTALWFSVVYGAGTFVAVAFGGTGNRVMTSSDGITWTGRSAVADLLWINVIYANNKFLAVSNSDAPDNCFMTSPDGVTWTRSDISFDIKMTSVAYGAGKFYAISSAVSGKSTLVISSADGITWESQTAGAVNNWRSITFANGLFVSVAFSGTGNRVMTFATSTPSSSNGPSAAELEAQRQREIAFKREKVLELVKNRRKITNESLSGADLPIFNEANLDLVNSEIAKLGESDIKDLVKITFILEKFSTVQRLGSANQAGVYLSQLIYLGIVDKSLYQKQFALSGLKRQPESTRDSIDEIRTYFQSVSDLVSATKERIRLLQKRLFDRGN
jgi:hypothetical protein